MASSADGGGLLCPPTPAALCPVQLPGLPEPVATKLLELPADDLDLMLQHPLAIHAQVCE